MKNFVSLITVIILVLSCVSLVQAGDRVDSYDLEAVPSGDAKVVNYTKDDYHYWRASLVKHLTENPQDMMEIIFTYPAGFGISKPAADRTALILRNRITSNLVDEGVIADANSASYKYSSVTGSSGDCRFTAVFHPPIVSYDKISEIADNAVNKVKRPANGVSLFAYAVGPFGGRGDAGPGVGYIGPEIFGQRVGLFLAVGAMSGPTVYPNGDRTEDKIQSVNDFILGGISILALRVDSDQRAGYFDLTPTVSVFHNGRAMDSSGQFGQVGVGGIVGLNFGLGWMSPGRNFAVKGFIEPGIGLGYWWQSKVRPYDVNSDNAVILPSYLVRAGVSLLF